MSKGLKYNILKYTGLFVIATFRNLSSLFSPRKPFYNLSNFPELKKIEDNYETIKQEYINFSRQNSILNIQDFFSEQKRITHGDNWKSYVLTMYGFDYIEHQQHFPKTMAVLNQIPGISSSMFSVLAGGGHITPHEGPYNGVLRYHLALIVPTPTEDLYIKINGVKKHWTEGQSMVFDDTYTHEAKNETAETRVVLFIDFVRPLPFPINKINQFLFGLIANSVFIQDALKNSAQLENVHFRKRKITF
jgi:aspartyl/asparaginyl beta-hydroxylase (cupin superfamily)